jgi:hypothetical protein
VRHGPLKKYLTHHTTFSADTFFLRVIIRLFFDKKNIYTAYVGNSLSPKRLSLLQYGLSSFVDLSRCLSYVHVLDKSRTITEVRPLESKDSRGQTSASRRLNKRFDINSRQIFNLQSESFFENTAGRGVKKSQLVTGWHSIV